MLLCIYLCHFILYCMYFRETPTDRNKFFVCVSTHLANGADSDDVLEGCVCVRRAGAGGVGACFCYLVGMNFQENAALCGPGFGDFGG